MNVGPGRKPVLREELRGRGQPEGDSPRGYETTRKGAQAPQRWRRNALNTSAWIPENEKLRRFGGIAQLQGTEAGWRWVTPLVCNAVLTSTGEVAKSYYKVLVLRD